MSEATFFLFKALMDVFTLGVVFNFLFRLLKVDYYNPLVQGIIRAVDFPSQFLRSFIRPIYSVDLATFLVASFRQWSESDLSTFYPIVGLKRPVME